MSKDTLPTKEGTIFDDTVDGYRIDLHANNTVPDFRYAEIDAAYTQETSTGPEAPTSKIIEFNTRPTSPSEAAILIGKIAKDWRWIAMSDEAKLRSEDFMERTTA